MTSSRCAKLLGGLVAGAAALATSTASGPARAQAVSPSEIAEVRAQIDQLTRRLAELEARAAPEPAETVAIQPPPAPASPPTELASVRPAEADGMSALDLRLSARRRGEVAVAPGPVDRPLKAIGSAFEVSATSGDGRVAVKLDREISTTGIPDGQVEGWGRKSIWSFSASAPINTGGDGTDIASFNGFASDFKASLQWSRFMMPLRDASDDPRALAIEAQARQTCLGKVDAVPEYQAPAGVTGNAAWLSVMAHQDKLAAAQKRRAACTAGMSSGFVRGQLGPALEDEYLSLWFPRKTGMAFGVEGAVGYKKYSFVDTALAKSDSAEHVPWSVQGFVSWLPWNSLDSYTVALEYAEGHKEKDKGVLCPASSGAPVQCLNGPLGAPEDADKLMPSFEYRRLIPNRRLAFLPKALGLSTNLTYEARSDEWALDVPFYFAAQKEDLIGGVRFGYTTEEDEFTAGVFVGAAFSIFAD